MGSCRQVVLLANRYQPSLHPTVAECAVVGIKDELRGRPVGFEVLKDGTNISQDQSTIDNFAPFNRIINKEHSKDHEKFL